MSYDEYMSHYKQVSKEEYNTFLSKFEHKFTHFFMDWEDTYEENASYDDYPIARNYFDKYYILKEKLNGTR